MNRTYISHQDKLKNIINFLILFGVIIVFRYFYVQVLNADQYSIQVYEKTGYIKNITGDRGNIFDRHGVLLATDIMKIDLWVNTKEDYDADLIIDFFHKNFDSNKIEIEDLIGSKKVKYLPIKKNIIISD